MQSEESSIEKEAVKQEEGKVKKVRISKSVKRTVKVKPVAKEPEVEKVVEVQPELPLESKEEIKEQPVKTKKTSPKSQASNRKKTRKAKEEPKVEESVKEEDPLSGIMPVPEMMKEEVSTDKEESLDPDNEETNAVEVSETENEGIKDAESDNQKQVQNKFNRNNKNSKFNKKEKFKNRRAVEEYPPEINAVENPDAPRLMLSEILTYNLDKLRQFAREKGISEEEILECRKQDLIEEILKHHAQSGGVIMVSGVIEVLPDGYGLIRYAINSYLSSPEDIYVPQNQIKQNGLRTGDVVFGQVRTPRDYDRSYVIFKIIDVNGDTPQTSKLRVPFDSLTPLFPDEKLHLEVIDEAGSADISTRVVDLFCPIGKGQRSLIVAPPRTGKTVLMQKIANAISANHPEVELIVLLVDERPEEVTDMRRNVKAEVVASTFDEQATRHVQVAEMVIEKAKRLVEYRKDVVILLDSITRLARAYNQTVPASGKILSGGVDSNALHKPKRFFGAARNIEDGGSLTIISTALIETGSRMDEVIFEEFKGTGNNEIVLDRRMADSRKFPAINIKKSGTRRDDLLLTKDEQTRIWLMRNAVANMDDVDMSVFLIDKMKKNSNNKEFLGSIGTNQ